MKAKKLQQIPLSNYTVKRRIADLADDSKQQVISEIGNSQFGPLSIQPDETPNRRCLLLPYLGVLQVAYLIAKDIKDNTLFCFALETMRELLMR